MQVLLASMTVKIFTPSLHLIVSRQCLPSLGNASHSCPCPIPSNDRGSLGTVKWVISSLLDWLYWNCHRASQLRPFPVFVIRLLFVNWRKWIRVAERSVGYCSVFGIQQIMRWILPFFLILNRPFWCLPILLPIEHDGTNGRTNRRTAKTSVSIM